MPANVYECMFLLDTNKVAGDIPAATKRSTGSWKRTMPRSWPAGHGTSAACFSRQGPQEGALLSHLCPHRQQERCRHRARCVLNEMILRMLILHVDASSSNPCWPWPATSMRLPCRLSHEPPPDEDGLERGLARLRPRRAAAWRRPRTDEVGARRPWPRPEAAPLAGKFLSLFVGLRLVANGCIVCPCVTVHSE